VGRFASTDAAPGVRANPLTFHQYLYTLANPVNLKDPTGRYEVGSVLSGGIVATVVAFILLFGALICLAGRVSLETRLSCGLTLLVALGNPSPILAIVAGLIDDFLGFVLETFVFGTLSLTALFLVAFFTIVIGGIISIPFLASFGRPVIPGAPAPLLLRGLAGGLVIGAAYWADFIVDQLRRYFSEKFPVSAE
jgi:hypothetical protein